jgi:hypothetical protein
MAERKGKKLRRSTPSSKAYYKVQFGVTDTNRAKRMRRHLRANPADKKAIVRYEQNMGRADSVGFNSRGRKLLKRAA